ncbi:MAG: putative 4-hydroxybenzoate polyprenyltransferase [Desulfovibrio sp.]|nr:putative 4-hydroxybenzoate polyprenyltransferase [Desulfovibrio sp.]
MPDHPRRMPYTTFFAFCRMVRIEHSVFALPFAYVGALLTARGLPGPEVLLPLTAAMVCIRSYAMAFNRIADLPLDRINPRTAGRPLVTGEISPAGARRFCAVTAAGFVASCAALNSLCLVLAFPTLALAALYSYAKRVTRLCHFLLGAVIGLAPVAGALGVSPVFEPSSLLLGFAVLFWIAGFDIIYACMDLDFDRAHGVHSLPACSGVGPALAVSAFCHVNTVLFLFLAGLEYGQSAGWYAALAVTAALFLWEHGLVGEGRLENAGFAFALNGPIAVLLLIGAALGMG